MRGTYRLQAGVLAAVTSLALVACGGDDEPSGNGGTGGTGGSPTGSGTAPATAELKIGLAYDIGGRGDQSFNDLAAKALDEAKTKYNLDSDDVRELEAAAGEPESAKEARLTLLADNGFKQIVAVGFAYEAAVKKVAPKYTSVQFAIVDAVVAAPNVTSLVFAEEQGSFLVGVAAALKSKTNHVGFIGGVNVELIKKFEAGFTAGAKAAKPNITVTARYLTQPPDFSGFNDATKGQTAANGMFDAGADVIYAAAGGSGTGMFRAAKAKGKLGIGVDSDQINTVPADLKDVVMTSMLKKVDVAVGKFIDDASTSSLTGGTQVFDLKADGVGYSTTGGQVDDIKTQLEDYKSKIVSGAITVPTK